MSEDKKTEGGRNMPVAEAVQVPLLVDYGPGLRMPHSRTMS